MIANIDQRILMWIMMHFSFVAGFPYRIPREVRRLVNRLETVMSDEVSWEGHCELNTTDNNCGVISIYGIDRNTPLLRADFDITQAEVTRKDRAESTLLNNVMIWRVRKGSTVPESYPESLRDIIAHGDDNETVRASQTYADALIKALIVSAPVAWKGRIVVDTNPNNTPEVRLYGMHNHVMHRFDL